RQIYSSPHATQASPTFSPDEKNIAFVSDKDGPPRIYVMHLPGAKDTQRFKPELITIKNRENTSPAWSPNGKKLAYSAKTDGIRQIWIYDFATKEEIQLTQGPENKENPAWAPDSLHLVYNTESATGNELYLIHLLEAEPISIGKGRFASWETR
ncbi:MAG: translocation protein TolB, partial [Chlamydiae bacterium]|nr:translocation protein TolB [Chlamydiota bacterium]